jgi:type I restriction enzyme S subunit
MSENTFLEKLLDEAEIQWVPLGDVARILNGYSFKSSKYSDVGIRVIRISDVQKGKMSDKNQKFYPIELKEEIERYLLNENDLVMSLTGNAGRVAILSKKDLPAGLNQRVACIRSNENTVLTRFLFHFLDRIAFETEAMNNATGAGQKNLSTKWLAAYAIPIPCPENPEKSLAIQAEIVRILDTFTELTAELTAELISELTARKKQFNYYRDQLLTFEEGDIEWKTLGEVGEFVRGKRFVKADMISEGVPCIHYGEMYTHYGIWADKAKSCVTSELVKKNKLRTAEKGNVVMVAAGETIEDIGMGTAWLSDEGVVIHDACFTYRSGLNPKYVAYFTRTKFFQSQVRKSVSSGKISAINAKGLSKVTIPIPSIAEQARIVGILDKFDTLTHSISEGLPREIELRQKQYEYYRGLLLNFPIPEPETEGVA